ncbi:MAG: hypothetical protein U1F05_11555 [Burkholderiales bacterium]
MTRMIDFYNAETERFHETCGSGEKRTRRERRWIHQFDPYRISWTRALKQHLAKNRRFYF